MKTIQKATVVQEKAVDLDMIIKISKIVSLHYFEFDKDFNFDGEKHNFWEMVYVDSGSVLAKADDKSYVLKQGDIIFHKPNEFHAISADKKTPSNVIIVTFVTNSKYMAWFKNKRTILPTKYRHYIKTIIDEGEKTFLGPLNDINVSRLDTVKTPPVGSLQIIKSSLEQLLIFLVRSGSEKKKAPQLLVDADEYNNPIANSLARFLEDNVYEKITIEEICKKFSYSKPYLSKLFLASCGCTIMEYHTKLKIKEAKKLIREKVYTITQISGMLSFGSPHYFSKVFKKYAKMTPSEYQESMTKK